MMEGAGVRICRTIGTSALRNLDPFLMLDELKMPSDQATAGGQRPHRRTGAEREAAAANIMV